MWDIRKKENNRNVKQFYFFLDYTPDSTFFVVFEKYLYSRNRPQFGVVEFPSLEEAREFIVDYNDFLSKYFGVFDCQSPKIFSKSEFAAFFKSRKKLGSFEIVVYSKGIKGEISGGIARAYFTFAY